MSEGTEERKEKIAISTKVDKDLYRQFKSKAYSQFKRLEDAIEYVMKRYVEGTC